MDFTSRVLGAAVTKQLSERHTVPVLKIGSDTLTRSELSQVECFNFLAAQRLSDIVNKELHVKNLKQVYETVAPSAFALPGIGSIALAVLGAAFEARGIGGEHPLDSYVAKHQETVTTFATLKTHELESRRGRKRSRHGRNGRANGR